MHNPNPVEAVISHLDPGSAKLVAVKIVLADPESLQGEVLRDYFSTDEVRSALVSDTTHEIDCVPSDHAFWSG